MPVTTDDQPGARIEEEVQFEPQSTDPTVDGAVRFKDDDLVLKTSAGVKSLTTGTGLNEASHEALDSLTHMLTETHNLVVTRASGKVSEVLCEETGGTDIRKLEVLTRSGGKVATFRITQYDSNGSTVKRQLDCTVNRTSGRVSSINVVRTVKGSGWSK